MNPRINPKMTVVIMEFLESIQNGDYGPPPLKLLQICGELHCFLETDGYMFGHERDLLEDKL